MFLQPAHPKSGFRLRTLALLLSAPFWAACGGGGGGSADATPVVDPTADTVTVSSDTVDANTNVTLALDSEPLDEGVFVAPITCHLLGEDGVQIGPDCAGTVLAEGRRVEMETPLMPELREDVDVIVELRDARGRRARSGRRVRVRGTQGPRSVDGSGNNADNPDWGRASTALREDVGRAYGDAVAAPGGAGRPDARTISNLVCDQELDLRNAAGASDMFWLWGQFIDHDIDLTPGADPAEEFSILIPQGDPYFDPFGTGTETMSLHRSTWEADTGTDALNPRRQTNVITSYIDASNVYGSDAERAAALRTNDGTGRLRTSAGDLLPFNTPMLPNAPTGQDPTFFLAGDIRANENAALTAMHTIWMREHNRIVDDLRARNAHLTGEQLYQAARRYVGAELQVITVREFLPLLLGTRPLGRYRGYRDDVDSSIGVYFSTAAYRFGHSMVSGDVLRLEADGQPSAEGPLLIRDAFFNPTVVQASGAIDALMRGVAGKTAQAMDPYVVDDLRNFLFGPPGAGGLDLAALNVQRGRDHGLPDYNGCRAAFGLAPHETFAAVTGDAERASRLEAAFGTPADMDVWVAALAEDAEDGALVGELLATCFRDQFRRLRDGDRHWYERLYRGEALAQLEQTRLADVIRRNTGVGAELSDDVFRVSDLGLVSLQLVSKAAGSDAGERDADVLRTLMRGRVFR